MPRPCVLIATPGSSQAVGRLSEAMALEWMRRGVDVVSVVPPRELGRPLGDGHVLERWPSVRPTRPRDFRFLASLVRRHRPRVVVAHFGAVNVTLLVAWALRVPRRVAWVHTIGQAIDLDGHAGLRSRVLVWRKAGVRRTASLLVANSEAMAAEIAGHVRPGRVVIRPLLLDDPIPELGDAPEPPGKRRIVNVGRFEVSKGTDVLIDAFALVTADHPDVELELVGDGPLGDELRAQASAAGVADRCTFVGRVPRDEALRRLATATVVVVASRAEAFGLAAVEGMALGRAVIASDTGGIPEVLTDGHDGVLVPPGDAPALAAALHGLLADPDRAAALGRAARETFEARFSTDRVGELVDVVQGHALDDADVAGTAPLPARG